MSTEAYVIGMGRFKKGMEHILDYDAAHYENIPEGTPVVAHFFRNCHGDYNASKLSAALGLGDNPYDFTKHYIESENQVDYDGLAELADVSEWGITNEKDVYTELLRFGKAMELGMKMMFYIDF